MKFAHVALGTRAERPVSFAYRDQQCATAVRPLTGEEQGIALAGATAYAQEQKAAEVKPGNAQFDLGRMANEIAIAFVDVDSDPKNREAFFKDANEVLGLDVEVIQYLHARQQVWQEECSPSRAKMSSHELVGTLIRIAEADDDRFFSQLRPGLQWTLLRTTAGLFLNSPEGKSLITSLSAMSLQESTKKKTAESPS